MSRQFPMGPFYPNAEKNNVFCIAGDEPLMFKTEEKLNPRERTHLEAMRSYILPYAMATIPMSKASDTVVLDSAILEKEHLLKHHLESYQKAGIEYSRNIQFVETKDIYSAAMRSAKDETTVCTVCYSYELAEHRHIADELESSRYLNSKIELYKRSQRDGFRVPLTEIFSKKEITEKGNNLMQIFDGKEILIKTDGLGGGYNVTQVKSYEDAKNFVAPFDDHELFVLQEKIDRTSLDEFAVDFIVRKEGAELYDARKKLTYNNQWFGNIYLPKFSFTDHQMENMQRCVEGIRKLGYSSLEGNVCCLDLLQGNEEQYILEINGRWTGGFPVAYILKKMNIDIRSPIISYLDSIRTDELNEYMAFIDEKLVCIEKPFVTGDYRVFPVGFCPKEEEGKIFIWLLVFGDFNVFINDTKVRFSENSFTMAGHIERFL